MASSSTISLEQFVALNDEIVALTRAGVPLPEGLRELSRELPGRLGSLAAGLGQRLEAGATLERAVSQAGDRYSPVYAAVIRAGIRSGSLPAALESLSTTLRRVAGIRRGLMAALIYPLILMGVASVLGVLFLTRTVPVTVLMYERFEIEQPPWYRLLLTAFHSVLEFLPWFWLVFLVLLAGWWYFSSRAIAHNRGLLGCLPAVHRLFRFGRLATFTEILALLVERRVPLQEAVVLAATASGDQQLLRGARTIAEQIARGDISSQTTGGIPPLLAWTILKGAAPERLAHSLRRSAQTYRRRMARWGTWVSVYLPIFVSAVVGGLITLFYALLTFAPFYNLLYQLGK